MTGVLEADGALDPVESQAKRNVRRLGRNGPVHSRCKERRRLFEVLLVRYRSIIVHCNGEDRCQTVPLSVETRGRAWVYAIDRKAIAKMRCQLKRIGKEVGYRTKGTSERCKRYRYRYDGDKDPSGYSIEGQ